MGIFLSPFIVPVAGMIFVAVLIISGAVSKAHARRLKAEQRMAMVARGMKAEEIALLLNQAPEDLAEQRARDAMLGTYSDPLRGLRNARRVAIVLCSAGVGAILFFVVLVQILGDHEIYSGAAAALVPLAIGIGFFIDYYLQKRDFEAARISAEPRAGV
jgi:uncharacterized membrane protein